MFKFTTHWNIIINTVKQDLEFNLDFFFQLKTNKIVDNYDTTSRSLQIYINCIKSLFTGYWPLCSFTKEQHDPVSCCALCLAGQCAENMSWTSLSLRWPPRTSSPRSSSVRSWLQGYTTLMFCWPSDPINMGLLLEQSVAGLYSANISFEFIMILVLNHV